jgi:nicotinamidase-related amidase
VVTLADTCVDRLSGLWGAQTPLGLWLQENEITTLFFGGVNADQCVVGSFVTSMGRTDLLTYVVGYISRCILQGLLITLPRP